MVITVWSVKGGSGVTTLSTVMASALSRTGPNQTGLGNSVLLVDLGNGDLRGILSAEPAEDPQAGFSDWVTADETLDASALTRLISSSAVPLLGMGTSHTSSILHSSRIDEGLNYLDTQYAHVVIDAGSADSELTQHAVRNAKVSLLVARPCMLSLRKAVSTNLPATAMVMMAQPGSSLQASSLEASLGIPVITTMPFSPHVGRAIETSRLFSHPPRNIRRSIKPVLSLIAEYQAA